MELKDVILSTLAEMENDAPVKTTPTQEVSIKKESVSTPNPTTEISERKVSELSDSELMYLSSIRERLLVLFEGFQAPNNTNIEAKVDMTLNFLEYVLATIDTRLEKLEKRDRE